MQEKNLAMKNFRYMKFYYELAYFNTMLLPF